MKKYIYVFPAEKWEGDSAPTQEDIINHPDSLKYELSTFIHQWNHDATSFFSSATDYIAYKEEE